MKRKIWRAYLTLFVMVLAFPMTVAAEEATTKSFVPSTTMLSASSELDVPGEDPPPKEETLETLDECVEFNSVEYLAKKGVKLTWDELEYNGKTVYGYLIYRYDYDFLEEAIDHVNYDYWTIEGNQTFEFIDSTAKFGHVYYYTIVGVLGEDDVVSATTSIGDESIGAVLVIEKPKFALKNTDKGIKVTWNSVSAANGYIIYRRKSGGTWSEKPYKFVEGGSKTYFDDSSVTAGQGYYYRVTAYMDDPAYPEYYWETDLTDEAYMRRLKTPVVKVTNAKSSIKVAWDTVKGATGYEVYRDGVLVKTTTSKSWFDYNKIIGKKYVYTVKAYYKGGSGVKYLSQASAKKTIYRVPQAAIKSLTKGTGKFTVKYNAVSKATGYQITYSRYSDFRTKASKTTTALSKAVSGLTRNKTYYVKIRAYKTVNGVKYYGQYSTVKKITVK